MENCYTQHVRGSEAAHCRLTATNHSEWPHLHPSIIAFSESFGLLPKGHPMS